MSVPELEVITLIDRLVLPIERDIAKVSQREITARLEILKNALENFGLVKGWNWQECLEKFVIKSLEPGIVNDPPNMNSKGSDGSLAATRALVYHIVQLLCRNSR